MRRPAKSIATAIFVVLLIVVGLLFLQEKREPSRGRPSSGVGSNVSTTGGGSSGAATATRIRRPTMGTTQTVSVVSASGSSARVAGGRAEPSSNAEAFKAPLDMLAAVRDALVQGDENKLHKLLEVIRSNPAAHVSTIVALALDAAMPDSIRARMISLMRGLRDSESLQALLEISTDTKNAGLRAESLKALGVRGESRAEEELRRVATDSEDPANAMAISLLGTGQDPESRKLLQSELKDPAASDETKNAALYALRHYGDAENVGSLLAVTSNTAASARLRATALYSLGVIGDPAALPAVKANLASEEREVKYSATLAATRVADVEVTASLVPSLCDMSNFPHVRKAASAALAKNATVQDLGALRDAISTTDGFGIRLACEVFEAKRDVTAVPILQSLSREITDAYVLKGIETTIEAIQQGDQ